LEATNRLAWTPAAVAGAVDGRRWRPRAAARGPGVHPAKPKDDKSACLVSLRPDTHAPEP
jgi:hypothetical protein